MDIRRKIKDFDLKTNSDKSELLDELENKNNKKIKFREDFVRFSPSWCKFHMIIPLLTLIATIASCIVPVAGFLDSVYPFILYSWVYSFAIIGTCILIIPLRFLASKSVNNLKSENETINDEKRQLELSDNKMNDKSFELEVSKNENKDLQRVQSFETFSNEVVFEDNIQNEEEGFKLSMKKR